MTSNDTDTITVQLKELISVNKEQIAEMKTLAAQIQRDNAEFHALMIKEFSDFTRKQEERFDAFSSKFEAKFEAFSQKSDTRFDRLETQIAVMQNDITGLKHDVASLFHWDYWILTFVAAALVIPHLPDIMKSLVGAVTQSVSAIASLFSKRKNYDA